jgi:hypothetical protein
MIIVPVPSILRCIFIYGLWRGTNPPKVTALHKIRKNPVFTKEVFLKSDSITALKDFRSVAPYTREKPRNIRSKENAESRKNLMILCLTEYSGIDLEIFPLLSNVTSWSTPAARNTRLTKIIIKFIETIKKINEVIQISNIMIIFMKFSFEKLNNARKKSMFIAKKSTIEVRSTCSVPKLKRRLLNSPVRLKENIFIKRPPASENTDSTNASNLNDFLLDNPKNKVIIPEPRIKSTG